MRKFTNAEQMIRAIDLTSLSNIIKDKYGIEATFELIELDNYGFRIKSNNLRSQTGNIGLMMFADICITVTCGRDIIAELKKNFENNKFDVTNYFALNLSYNHYDGGSNGLCLGRGWIGYNFESNKWEYVSSRQ
jgi:hypothetical protein